MRGAALMLGVAFSACNCGTPTLTVSALATKTLDVELDDVNYGPQFYPDHEGWLRLNNAQEGCYAFDPSIVAMANGVNLLGPDWPTRRPSGPLPRGCSQPYFLIPPDVFDGGSTLTLSLTDATGTVTALFPDGSQLRDVQLASGAMQGGAPAILSWTPSDDALGAGSAAYTPDTDAGFLWKVGFDGGSFIVPSGQVASTGTLTLRVTAVAAATTCTGVAGCSATLEVERVIPASYH